MRTPPRPNLPPLLNQWPILLALAFGVTASIPLARAEGWLWPAVIGLWVAVPIFLGFVVPRRAVACAVGFNVSLYAFLPVAVRWLDPGRDWVADQPLEFLVWWLLRGIGAGTILAQLAGLPTGLRRYKP